MVIVVFKIGVVLVSLLISIAYLTLAERKVLGYIQSRKGPNVVGVYGLLQPLADGLKLFTKEIIIPNHANTLIYIVAPILSLTLAFIAWGVIPYGPGVVLSDLGIGVLYLFVVSSISVYAVLMSGWSSNSKYAFLGAIRAAAQMISYEVSIGLIIIAVVLCVGSLSLSEIVMVQENIPFIFPLFPAAIMFFVSVLAETNRVPFDLTEGESELVSGFNVEYSSMSFALFFLAEYCHIILMSTFGVLLFLSGWLLPSSIFVITPSLYNFVWFGIKIVAIVFLFIWIRATYPRIRYDQLMTLLWKSYLPLSGGFVVLVSGILIGESAFPPA
uniref:NADH-ubiquinone oxidoreductase chain 1 n=1 Tax=Cinachyrella kuekenthali TaxID=458489 RepID=I6LIF5_9METZ|nr:NADH dehydrogenase subunit 1 [Cinachyrella kuekenthali]ABW83836.1 NADH dehydrogenase subunit 1 [Cinachyrella kuekenthali]